MSSDVTRRPWLCRKNSLFLLCTIIYHGKMTLQQKKCQHMWNECSLESFLKHHNHKSFDNNSRSGRLDLIIYSWYIIYTQFSPCILYTSSSKTLLTELLRSSHISDSQTDRCPKIKKDASFWCLTLKTRKGEWNGNHIYLSLCLFKLYSELVNR